MTSANTFMWAFGMALLALFPRRPSGRGMAVALRVTCYRTFVPVEK
jgi:hypothetical protein